MSLLPRQASRQAKNNFAIDDFQVKHGVAGTPFANVQQGVSHRSNHKFDWMYRTQKGHKNLASWKFSLQDLARCFFCNCRTTDMHMFKKASHSTCSLTHSNQANKKPLTRCGRTCWMLVLPKNTIAAIKPGPRSAASVEQEVCFEGRTSEGALLATLKNW